MLHSPAHPRRCRRFADTLTSAAARLAEKRGWLILRFSGLSPIILCQLAWHTGALTGFFVHLHEISGVTSPRVSCYVSALRKLHDEDGRRGVGELQGDGRADIQRRGIGP